MLTWRLPGQMLGWAVPGHTPLPRAGDPQRWPQTTGHTVRPGQLPDSSPESWELSCRASVDVRLVPAQTRAVGSGATRATDTPVTGPRCPATGCPWHTRLHSRREQEQASHQSLEETKDPPGSLALQRLTAVWENEFLSFLASFVVLCFPALGSHLGWWDCSLAYRPGPANEAQKRWWEEKRNWQPWGRFDPLQVSGVFWLVSWGVGRPH